VEAVDLDELEQLHEALRPGELDRRLGAGAVEPALLHEHLLLRGVDDAAHVCAHGDGVAAAELGDLGIDEVDLPLLGDRDPVVAVDDEVGVAQLEHDDGRKPALGVGPLDVDPSLPHVGARGQEVLVEVARTARRPDDLAHRYGTDPDVGLLEDPHALLDLVERHRRGARGSGHDAAEAPVGLLAAGLLERRRERVPCHLLTPPELCIPRR
jgi:hypothetical protein